MATSFINRDQARSFEFPANLTAQYIADNNYVVSSGDVVNIGNLTLVAHGDQRADGTFVGFFGPPTNIYNIAVVGENVDQDDVNEVVSVDITGTPTGGDFTLTFGGQTTAAIAFDANAAAVQAALEALSSIGSGNVAVTGTNPTFTVTFQGTLAGTNVGAITKDETGLTGGTSPDISISVDTEGVDGDVPVAIGDYVYVDAAEVNVDSNNGVRFGIALETVAEGGTSTIAVLKTHY